MIRADLHSHTVASGHAFSTLDEMTAAARSAGLEALAITDHGPSMAGGPHSGYFEMASRLPDVLDGLRVLFGVEANVVDSEGTLDLDSGILRDLDLVVAGLHERTPYAGSTVRENTDAIVCAIESGLVHVISHPYTANFPTDVEVLAKASAANGVLLELNAAHLAYALRSSTPQSQRVVDEARRMVDALVTCGGFCSLSSDAHHTSDVGSFEDTTVLISSALDIPLTVVANRELSSLRALGWSV